MMQPRNEHYDLPRRRNWAMFAWGLFAGLLIGGLAVALWLTR